MVTATTWERRGHFRNERWAKLLIDVLYHYRGSAYLLHEFVIMPDHLHVLITPLVSLEKAVPYIKGGFSYRAKKELGSNVEVWQKGFQDHRIRDVADYDIHVAYIHGNPGREHLCEDGRDYPYSFVVGAPKGAPFQNISINSNKHLIRSAPVQNDKSKIA